MHNSKQPILFPQIKVGQYILEEMECEASSSLHDRKPFDKNRDYNNGLHAVKYARHLYWER